MNDSTITTVKFSKTEFDKLFHILVIEATASCLCDDGESGRCPACYARELGSGLFSNFDNCTDGLGRSVQAATEADAKRMQEVPQWATTEEKPF